MACIIIETRNNVNTLFSGHRDLQNLKASLMKSKLLGIMAIVPFCLASCSTADLGGQVPLPFTSHSTSAKLDLELRPMPPKFCIGLDLVPTEKEEGK